MMRKNILLFFLFLSFFSNFSNANDKKVNVFYEEKKGRILFLCVK